MSEMVERVARSVCKSTGLNPDEIMSNDGPRWRYYVPGAYAAIEAMREPTEAMEDAGWHQLPDHPDDWSPISAYQRMIDAALND